MIVDNAHDAHSTRAAALFASTEGARDPRSSLGNVRRMTLQRMGSADS